jgi:hypothetical protein
MIVTMNPEDAKVSICRVLLAGFISTGTNGKAWQLGPFMRDQKRVDGGDLLLSTIILTQFCMFER